MGKLFRAYRDENGEYTFVEQTPAPIDQNPSSGLRYAVYGKILEMKLPKEKTSK